MVNLYYYNNQVTTITISSQVIGVYVINNEGWFLHSLTVGGMKRWGIRGYELINRYEPCQREMRLADHSTPNVL